MNRRALYREQRLDCLDYVAAAINDVRACIEIAPDVGPLIVAAYRALGVLGELREVLHMLPTIAEDPRP